MGASCRPSRLFGSTVYGIKQARFDQGFDQGKFHHPRPKPTTVATNSWYLYEALDQQVLSSEERAAFNRGQVTTSQRLQQAL